MQLSNTKKIIIAVVLIGVLGFLIYTFFIKDSDIISADLINPPEDEIVGQDILKLVEKFKSVSIDQSLFSGVLFSNLKDFSATVSPDPQGRPDPFGSIESEVKPVTVKK